MANPLAAFSTATAPQPATRSKNPLAAFVDDVDPGQTTNRNAQGFLGRIEAGLGIEPPPPGRSPAEYLGEMVGNIPESAGAVAGDLYEALSHPLDTLGTVAGAAAGGVQLLKEQLGIPVVGAFGEHRDKARAVGDFYNQGYGGGQEFLDSLRTDPVGVGLDVGGLVTGGAGAAARLPGVAGRLARAITHADPVAAGGRAVGRMQAQRGPRVPSRREFVADAPSPAEMQTQASTLFEAAEQSGVRCKHKYYAKFVRDTLARMVDEGADKILSPKISRIADVLEASKGRAPSIAQMAIVRKQFGNAAASADRAEARLGSIGVGLVDDFVESGASHVGGQLSEARTMWSRLKKSEIIDTAIENAQAAQAGVEAGLRNEFRGLWRARNSKKMRAFSDAELAAIKSVAQGNLTSNALRRIGSLGGGLDQGRNMLNLMAGTAGGALVGGPIGAAAVPLAGYAAARMSKTQTSNRAALARAITARGETPRQAAAMRPTPAAAKHLERIAQRYPSGAAPVAAPVGVGAERSQDTRRRR